jgi:hypothetical protein
MNAPRKTKDLYVVTTRFLVPNSRWTRAGEFETREQAESFVKAKSRKSKTNPIPAVHKYRIARHFIPLPLATEE